MDSLEINNKIYKINLDHVFHYWPTWVAVNAMEKERWEAEREGVRKFKEFLICTLHKIFSSLKNEQKKRKNENLIITQFILQLSINVNVELRCLIGLSL